MYATPDQIEEGIKDYAMQELVPKAGDVERVVIGTIMDLFAGKAGEMARQYSDNAVLKIAEVSDGTGRYDVEKLKNSIINGAQTVGVNRITVKMLPGTSPITFSPNDVEKLYQFIANHV